MKHTRNNHRIQPEASDLKLFYPKFQDWLTLDQYHYLKALSTSEKEIDMNADNSARVDTEARW